MPTLSTYTQIGEGTGGPFVSPEAQPPRNQMFLFNIPVRNQVLLVLFNEENISLIDSSILFAQTREISYSGLAENINTFFTDAGIKLGFILNITGSQFNDKQVNVTAIVPGTAIGTTQLIAPLTEQTKWDDTDGDFALNGTGSDFVFAANKTSTLVQAVADLPYPMEELILVRLKYNITVTEAPDGDFELYIPTYFSSVKIPLPFTAGEHIVEFITSDVAMAVDFEVVTECSDSTKGEFSIDDIEMVTAGISEKLIVAESLTDEPPGNVVTINQDPATIGIVYDIERDEFFKFTNLDVISSAILSGGNQKTNLNLFLTSTGKVQKYPEDVEASKTASTAWVAKTIESYYSDFKGIELDFTNADGNKATVDIEVQNQRFGVSTKQITLEGKEVDPLKSYPLPGGFFGNKIKFKIQDAEVIRNLVLTSVPRKKRV